jgi:hypothetical protein
MSSPLPSCTQQRGSGLTKQMIPLGPNGGAGSITMPVVGTVLAPAAIVKKGKAQNLLVQEYFVSRFKGARKVAIAM